MSSFPLTNSYFSRWFLHHQPVKNGSFIFLALSSCHCVVLSMCLRKTLEEKEGEHSLWIIRFYRWILTLYSFYGLDQAWLSESWEFHGCVLPGSWCKYQKPSKTLHLYWIINWIFPARMLKTSIYNLYIVCGFPSKFYVCLPEDNYLAEGQGCFPFVWLPMCGASINVFCVNLQHWWLKPERVILI